MTWTQWTSLLLKHNWHKRKHICDRVPWLMWKKNMNLPKSPSSFCPFCLLFHVWFPASIFTFGFWAAGHWFIRHGFPSCDSFRLRLGCAWLHTWPDCSWRRVVVFFNVLKIVFLVALAAVDLFSVSWTLVGWRRLCCEGSGRGPLRVCVWSLRRLVFLGRRTRVRVFLVTA